MKYPAECHPEKPRYGYGLCRACWKTLRRRQKGIPKRERGSAQCHPHRLRYGRGLCQPCWFKTWTNKRSATCHPERPHQAKGLCRQCYSAKQRQEYLARSMRLAYTFGITIEDYETLRKQQNSLCAICGSHESVTRNGVAKNLTLDHSRRSGDVRGLLCHRCNLGLGHFLDNPILLRRAAAYLEKDPAIPRTSIPNVLAFLRGKAAAGLGL